MRNLYTMSKFIFLFLLLPMLNNAQELAAFKINIQNNLINAPVSIALEGINYNTDTGELVLFEVNESQETYIPCQLETGHSAKLWFILKGESKPGDTREFILKREENAKVHKANVTIQRDHRDISLLANEKPILSYRHWETPAPDGADPIYKRSGYIHPLVSPQGEVLTRIQPKDHYHHYGIWGPWTKTRIDAREVDFWNLKLGQGTVKFAGLLSEEEGAIYSGFKALQQHIDFGALGEDQVAINEVLDVRTWNINQKVWIIDYTASINSPLANGILLDAYRYGGGIGFRATEKWHKNNCSVLTSDKKTRVDADGSFARWCIVEGESETESGRSGILFLSHPSNRMHPEPMRVWPENANGGRGDMYFEFVPIRHESWKLKPRQKYTLKYRMVIFDGEMDASEAEKYWKSFAHPPVLSSIN